MSENVISQAIEVDTPTYLSENPSATWEDLVKDCLKPAFQADISNLCYYVDIPYSSSVTYPALAIPWHDGVVDGGLLIYFDKNKTSTVGTSTGYPHLGIGANELKAYTVTQNKGSSTYSGGVITAYRLDQYKFTFRVVYYDDFQAIGIKDNSPTDSTVISCPYIITKFNKGESEVYGGFYTGFNGSSSSYYSKLNLYIYENDTASDYTFVPQQTHVVKSGAGLATPINDGVISNDYFYLISGNYSTCRGAWSNSDDARLLLKDDTYKHNLFYKNAIVINGESFDAWLLSNNTVNNSNPYPIVCRKHID